MNVYKIDHLTEESRPLFNVQDATFVPFTFAWMKFVKFIRPQFLSRISNICFNFSTYINVSKFLLPFYSITSYNVRIIFIRKIHPLAIMVFDTSRPMVVRVAKFSRAASIIPCNGPVIQ